MAAELRGIARHYNDLFVWFDPRGWFDIPPAHVSDVAHRLDPSVPREAWTDVSDAQLVARTELE